MHAPMTARHVMHSANWRDCEHAPVVTTAAMFPFGKWVSKRYALRMYHGRCRLNLASFVTTWMEPECDELVSEARNINYIDEAEYPSTTAIQNECAAPKLQMLMRLAAAQHRVSSSVSKHAYEV